MNPIHQKTIKKKKRKKDIKIDKSGDSTHSEKINSNIKLYTIEKKRSQIGLDSQINNNEKKS